MYRSATPNETAPFAGRNTSSFRHHIALTSSRNWVTSDPFSPFLLRFSCACTWFALRRGNGWSAVGLYLLLLFPPPSVWMSPRRSSTRWWPRRGWSGRDC